MPRLKPSKPAPTAIGAGDPVKGISGLDVGLRLVGSVLGLGALGFAIDQTLGSLPWMMLTGIILGFVVWMVDVVRRKPKA